MDGHPIEIFFSFVRSEAEVYHQIRKQLSPSERNGRIRCWSREDVQPGQVLEDQVKQHLENASVIALLVSADYLDSDHHYQIEVVPAMCRQQADKARVVPILARPCAYETTSFGALQVLPANGVPISKCAKRDAAYHEIAAGIEAVIPPASPIASQRISDAKDPVQPTPPSQLKPKGGRKSFFIGFAILLVVAFLIGEGIHVLVNPPQPDIILCLTTTSYTPDLNPPPDHGILHPAYLKTNFTLLNRSTTQSTVTFVHISILGRTGPGPLTRNSVDWAPTKPVVVAGKAIVPNIRVSTVVDIMAEITSFQSAESQVTWTGGLGKLVNHTFNGDWQNDPACSS